MSVNPISPKVVESLNKSLEWGIERKAESLDFFKDKLPSGVDCLSYLENNISYQFDKEKKKGIELFLRYIS
jgi:hypothetical protein